MAYNLGTARGDVRITYDSSGVAHATEEVRTLSDELTAASRQALRINVNDTVAQDRIQRIADELVELDRQVTDPNVEIDDVEANRRIRTLREQMALLDRDAADPSVRINIEPAEEAQLNRLRQNLHNLDTTTTTHRVRLNDAEARRQLAETERAVQRLNGQTARVNVEARGADSLITTLLKLRLGLIGLAAAFSPALIPIAASLTGLIGGLGAAGIAGAAGVGVLIGAFKSLKLASDPLVKGQLDGLKNQFKTMSESIRPQLLDATVTSLRGVHNVLGQLGPVFTGAGNAVQALSHQWELLSNSSAMQSFTAFLGRQAGPAITTFGNAAMKGLTGVMGVLQAFEPLIGPIEEGITSLSQRFATWGQGLASNPGFKAFLAYIRQATPLVIDFGRQVLGLGVDIVKALAPAGLVILKAVNQIVAFVRVIAQSKGFQAFANGIAAIVRGLGNFLEKLGNSQAFHAFINALGGALGKIGQFIGKLLESNELQAAFRTAMQILTPILRAVGAVFGFLADHMTTAKIIIGGLLIAFMPFTAALIGIIAAIKLVASNWGAIWNGIKAVFFFVWDAIKAYFQMWWTVFTAIFNTAISVFQAVWGAVWGAIKAVFTAIWDGIKAYFQLWWTVVSTMVTTYINIIRTIITTAWNVIQAVTSAVWNAIKAVIGAVWGGIQAVVSGAVNFVRSVVSGAWNAIRSATSAVWNAIRSAVSAAWGAIRSVVSGAVNAVRSVVSGAWNAIRSATSAVWNAIRSVVSGALNAVRSAVSGAMGAVRSAISSAWNAARNAVSSAIGGIVGLARGIGGRVLGALGNMGSLLYNAGRSIITGLLNGIKSAVEGVYHFVAGIAGKIRSLKGPISYDRTLLTPAGQAIMKGLLGGLQTGSRPVLQYAASIAEQIVNAMGQAQEAQNEIALAQRKVGSFGAIASRIATTPAAMPNMPSFAPAPSAAAVIPTQPSRTFAPTYQYVGPLKEELVQESRRLDDYYHGV